MPALITPADRIFVAALGWRARIALAQGLASTVAEFREQLSQQLVRL